MLQTTMDEDTSEPVFVSLDNSLDNSPCTMTLELDAPNFDIAPSDTKQTITIPATSSANIHWIISPKKVGTYDISLSGQNEPFIAQIIVNNVIGLSPALALILSYIGAVLGPALTVPFWIGIITDIRARRKKIASKT